MIKLVISDNEGSTTVVPLVRDEISIGRQEGNTIRLTERNVSRRHARLVRRNDAYVIEDLGSYNGVVVNGELRNNGARVGPGDQIVIGDYSLLVRDDAASQAPGSRASVAPAPTTPARVVMLGTPSPGAEFSLPDEGAIRLGRSEDLPIPINHRSVSREHAEVVPAAGGHVICDLGSANGMFVNGRRVDRHVLGPGDIVELGQVAFRYVAHGETYFFDPNDAGRYARATGLRNKDNARVAIVLLLAAVSVATIVLFTGDDAPAVVESAPNPATELVVAPDHGAPRVGDGDPHPPVSAQVATTPAAAGPDYGASLQACRDALAGQRFTEASAHAALALRARPADTAALECQVQGQRRFHDEQAFAKGQAALLRGEAEQALAQFALVSADSPVRNRPEWGQAAEAVAQGRLATAQGLIDEAPKRAAKIARGIAKLSGVSEATLEQAAALAKQAKQAKQASGERGRTQARSAARATSSGRKARARASAPKPTSRKASKVSGRGSAGNAANATSSAGAKAKPGALEAANACLARGDNRCVIKALAGKARSQREMALLIETYRAVGNGQAARKYMGIYVRKFPSAKRAAGYKAQLARASK